MNGTISAGENSTKIHHKKEKNSDAVEISHGIVRNILFESKQYIP